MSNENINKVRFTFKDLLHSVRRAFKDKEFNISEVNRILCQYTSEEQDWRRYVFFSDPVYTRNLVDTGNGFYNLMVLAWNPGQGSCIHDHSNASCFVKVLAGAVREIRYETPKELKEFAVLGDYIRERDDVAFMDDTLGVHEMKNDTANQAVTLHLYIPPFESCNRFNRITAKKKPCTMIYYSVEGNVLHQIARSHKNNDNGNIQPCC